MNLQNTFIIFATVCQSGASVYALYKGKEDYSMVTLCWIPGKPHRLNREKVWQELTRQGLEYALDHPDTAVWVEPTPFVDSATRNLPLKVLLRAYSGMVAATSSYTGKSFAWLKPFKEVLRALASLGWDVPSHKKSGEFAKLPPSQDIIAMLSDNQITRRESNSMLWEDGSLDEVKGAVARFGTKPGYFANPPGDPLPECPEDEDDVPATTQKIEVPVSFAGKTVGGFTSDLATLAALGSSWTASPLYSEDGQLVGLSILGEADDRMFHEEFNLLARDETFEQDRDAI